MPFLLALLLLTVETWCHTMVVGPTRTYKTIPAAIQSRLPLQEDLTIYVELPTLTYSMPHTITADPAQWNGYKLYIHGIKSAPEIVAYVEDAAVFEFTGEHMELRHENVVGNHVEGRLEGGRFKMYFEDHLGSTRMTVDENGSYGEVTYYRSMGAMVEQAVGPVPTLEKFTGKEFDKNEGINLFYFGARYYDADLGLWISPDVYRQFHSPYSYGTNPINSIDPDGNLQFDKSVTSEQRSKIESQMMAWAQDNPEALKALSEGFAAFGWDLEGDFLAGGKGPMVSVADLDGYYGVTDPKTGAITIDVDHFNSSQFELTATVFHELGHVAEYQMRTPDGGMKFRGGRLEPDFARHPNPRLRYWYIPDQIRKSPDPKVRNDGPHGYMFQGVTNKPNAK